MVGLFQPNLGGPYKIPSGFAEKCYLQVRTVSFGEGNLPKKTHHENWCASLSPNFKLTIDAHCMVIYLDVGSFLWINTPYTEHLG